MERSFAQRPGQPRVDRADAEVARALRVGIVEQRLDLRRREIWRDTQTTRAELETTTDGAQVLPADAWSDGLAGGAVPHDGGATLVRNADGVDGTGCRERRLGEPDRSRRHRDGVELDETGRRGVGQQRRPVLGDQVRVAVDHGRTR